MVGRTCADESSCRRRCDDQQATLTQAFHALHYNMQEIPARGVLNSLSLNKLGMHSTACYRTAALRLDTG